MINIKITEEKQLIEDFLTDHKTEQLFLEAIEFERTRQNRKFPDQAKQKGLTLDKLLVILYEEIGEASKAALEHNDLECCTELVECAAVCCKIVELKFPHLMRGVHSYVRERMLRQIPAQ